MQITTVGNGFAITVGWLIAVVVLVADIALLVTSGIDLKLGLLIGGLAIARLL